MKRTITAVLIASAAGAILMIPVGSTSLPEEKGGMKNPVKTIDLSSFSAEPPKAPLRLLFIHHSCGGRLLADPGPEDGVKCVYRTHPNGGGLRRLLEREGYAVAEASYGSAVGGKTDIFDWPPKFREGMDRVLSCAGGDALYEGDVKNDVVVFKPCYPNNDFSAEGSEPGDPAGPALTVANARAAYASLLPAFAKHPEALFVCVTAPPLAPKLEAEPLWKKAARLLLGKRRDRAASGRLARRFNDWLKDEEGWLAAYEGKNVVVFDYFDILTDEGESNLSRYATGGGCDSHPSREGNERAARLFAPFLNRAVRRAGLCE